MRGIRIRSCLWAGVATLGLVLGAWAADAEQGWWGLALNVEAESLLTFHPKVSQVKVVKVEPGSPAEKAGLQAGDLIVEVDGLQVAGAQGDALRAKMRKAPGESVRMKVKRGESAPIEVTLTAARKPASPS